LLLLLDSRCPPLHCPPSLRAYIQSAKFQKEVVLILTKADLVDANALEGWKVWVKEWWGRPVEVVTVMSYDQDILQGGSLIIWHRKAI
jgi:ribosome biogenesis GTPase A